LMHFNLSPEQRAAAESFLGFFLQWAERMGWQVPRIHVIACIWLATRGDLAVFRCFRGFGKSTLLAIYNAWRYKENPAYRILHQGDQDGTAYKTSRDTKRVLQKHPQTYAMGEHRGEVSFWWVHGADDERNPSMQAAGIMSNITSSRADEVQNDDVEVPRNIQTPDAREKLRYRLGEQTHILVPGGRKLYIGTPHTHDSLYDEIERMGADCLTIRMFNQERRIDNAAELSYSLEFVPEFVFAGIGADAKLLQDGIDYKVNRGRIQFAKAPGCLIDCYAESAWPERFDREEMIKRRRETRTINEWDSQYQLHAKPINQVRLDPERIIPYECEPVIRRANGGMQMWLGETQIVGMSLRYDPASGKLDSDVSAVALILQDAYNRRYWHRAYALTGEIAQFAEDGKTIIGGQVHQLCDIIEEFEVPRVTVETNGIGAFAPAMIKACLKQRKRICGVTEVLAVTNKNKRILEALEPLITSGMLWAHAQVLDGPLWDQMRDWNPGISSQPDDYLDAGAGAITDTPERLREISGIPRMQPREDWRPDAGAFDVALETNY
jgi:hypothetical protein